MNATSDGSPQTSSPVRLARYLASCGIASRRACESLIREGVVSVDGTPALTPAQSVVPGRNVVLCRGIRVRPAVHVCLLLNKPPGYTCSASDAHARRLIGELIPAHFGRLFTVGRLDRDSEGLILLTNDGDLAQHLAHPSRQVCKTYHVEVRGILDRARHAALCQGVDDVGEFLRPLAVRVLGTRGGNTCVSMVLQEGRKREIRRLCAALDLPVVRLRRVELGPLQLGSLAAGAWRELDASEVEALRQAGSRSTDRNAVTGGTDRRCLASPQRPGRRWRPTVRCPSSP